MAKADNDAEWSDPENWGEGFFGFYFSRRDSRLWVPKRHPGLGWTLNMGHPRAGAVLLGFILTAALLPALSMGIGNGVK